MMFQEHLALLNLRNLLDIFFFGGPMRFLLATCLITFLPQLSFADPTPMSSATYSNSGEQIGVPNADPIPLEPEKQEEQVKQVTDEPDFQIGPYKDSEYEYKVNHEDDNEQSQQ
jgi:hypothetical protein